MTRVQLLERLEALIARLDAEATRVSKEGLAKGEPYRSNALWHVRRDMADLAALVLEAVRVNR